MGKFKVFDMFSLLLKPEKCRLCEEWMPVHKTFHDGHETLERICPTHPERRTSDETEALEDIFNTGDKK